jgi:hypothetical protein
MEAASAARLIVAGAIPWMVLSIAAPIAVECLGCPDD